MNLKRVVLTVVIAAVVLLAAYFAATQAPKPAAIPESPPVAVATPAPAPTPELELTPIASPTPTAAEPTPIAAAAASGDQPITEHIPDLQTIRDQVVKDPHTTPPAMIAFSVDIAKRVNKLALDEAGAKQAFSELEDCTLGDKQKDSNSVQALCLLNAHKLAAKFPSLGGRFDKLSQQADPEAVRRAKALFK